jgi:predicted ester cyclase
MKPLKKLIMKRKIYYLLMLILAVIIKTNTAQAAPPDWENPSGFQYTMNFVSELQYLNGTISMNENDMVAAFVGDEIRGVSNPIAGLGMIFLSVAANTEGETLTFKAYLADSDEIVDLNETSVFANMGEVGEFADPFIFTIFQGTYYTITASAGTGGSIDPDGAVQVMEDGAQTFTITADEGYNIADVIVDGTSEGAVTSYSFTDVTTDHTIEAVFEIITYTITATAGDNGSIAPVGETTVDYGSDQTFTITADEGYHVLDVLVDGISAGAIASYTFTNVTADHTIAASFEINSYTITASAGANGSITPSGDISVTHGSDQSFTITADAGYHVDDVLVDGVSVGAVTVYNFENISEAHTIAASFVINTYTITATAGENGSINPSGAIELDHGSDQSFTITANTGYDIEDVLVDGESVGAVNVYNFENVTANHTIAVSFSIQTFTITATAGANGTIDPSGEVSVAYGSDQSFSIIPDDGYHVVDVLVDGTSVGAVSTYAFEDVTAAHTIAASFEINTYTLTYIAGENGSLTGTLIQTVEHGSNGTAVEAIPDETYSFVGWSDGSAENPRIDENVTADLTVTANFAFNTYTITATSGENGAIAPAGEIVVGEGLSQEFTMIPDVGYQVADVLVDGTSVGDVETYEFQNVTADHTIDVSFELINYEIIATAGEGGIISPSGTVNVDHGLNQVFTVTPNEGYHIDDVLVDGVSVGAVDSYEFINVTEPHSIDASFAINVYTLTYLAGENGSLTGDVIQNVEHGSNGTAVTAEADAMYHFVDWSDGLTDNPRTDLNVTADLTVTANFAINTHTITATSSENGTITPAGAISVDEGSDQSFTITPNEGYYVEDVLVDGVSVGPVTNYEFTAIDTDHTIHASFAIYTYTITASAGSNGTIDPIGEVEVDHGQDQTFFMLPDEGYHVDDILIDGVSAGALDSYTFDNVIADHTIEAGFAINVYTLTYLAGENGSITGEAVQSVEHGSDGSEVTAVADDGYHFVNWSDGLTENPRTDVNVTDDLTVTANFELNTYIISASAGVNGSITPSGDVVVDHGSDQTFTITPDENYYVDDVLVDGVSVGALSTYTFENVTEAHTIHAIFAINSYTITASAEGNGSITPSGTLSYTYGDSEVFVFTPDAGHHIADVLVDGNSVGIVDQYEFAFIEDDHTIVVQFEINTYTITATAGDHGSIDPDGQIVIDWGEDATFTFEPDEEFMVDEVFVDGESIGYAESYTFENVTNDHEIQVTFRLIVGLEDVADWQSHVEVYPNPVVNRTTIEFTKLDINKANLSYEIYDYAGAVVQSGRLVDNATQIDMSTLAASRYIMRILDKQTVKATFKLVKIN